MCFDKRDDYPFFIVRMPDLSGNIPSHVFYGSVMSEFLSISRCTLQYPDFLKPAISFFKRMINQGGRNGKRVGGESKTDDINPTGCRAYDTPLDTSLTLY